jgi:acyl-CoA synthetase (AMP-forming)/AMP-acid ligase II
MLVHRLLEGSAGRTPDATALIDVRRTITYGDLDRLANRFGNVLRSAGVRRGDRVVVAVENSVEWAGAYFGALKAGAVAVPLPAGPKSDRLAPAVVDCSPAAAIVDEATVRDIPADHPLRSVAAVFVIGSDSGGAQPWRDAHAALAAQAETAPGVRCIDQDLAAIIYTSGSTGEPRGVMLTHRNFLSNARSIVGYLGLTASDRVISVLPFYYVYGLSLLHTHIFVGGSVLIENRSAFPNIVLDSMQRHGVTGFAGVPSTFAFLLARSSLESFEFPALRYVTQAGGNMPAAQIQEWLRRGPRVPFFVMYGATEAAARLTYLDPQDLPSRIGSIGRPVPNVQIVVAREDGLAADIGDVGELVARGSNIAQGYWNNAAETREKFTTLGYRTGDLGYRDESGYLYLVGRRHDMLKVGAHRVGAKEIEDVLYQHPAVLEAAVVAAPHELLGEVPVAFVAVRPEVRTRIEELASFCSARLPVHKVPRQFVLEAELPKIPDVGKIDKRKLRDRLAGARLTEHAISTPAKVSAEI